MKRSKLILSSLAIASFLIGSGVILPRAFAQSEEDRQRELYYDNERFETLSGAAQSLLELKFGKKSAPPSQPTPGATTPDSLSAIEEDLDVLVNNPSEDLTARDTQSETTLASISTLRNLPHAVSTARPISR
jgi:hypothetical protein